MNVPQICHKKIKTSPKIAHSIRGHTILGIGRNLLTQVKF